MARTTPQKVTRDRPVFACPACNVGVTITETFQIGDLVPDLDTGKATAETKLIGTQVFHDCRPKVQRKTREPKVEPVEKADAPARSKGGAVKS